MRNITLMLVAMIFGHMTCCSTEAHLVQDLSETSQCNTDRQLAPYYDSLLPWIDKQKQQLTLATGYDALTKNLLKTIAVEQTVAIAFKFNERGKIIELAVVQSPGTKELDDQLVQFVRSLAPITGFYNEVVARRGIIIGFTKDDKQSLRTTWSLGSGYTVFSPNLAASESAL